MGAKGDDIDGVMLLDKPAGMSSNWALQLTRRLINAKKAGHTGTLDPMASGLLPLAFGNATKYSSDLLHADKRYEAELTFGAATDTMDKTGAVTESSSKRPTKDELVKVLGNSPASSNRCLRCTRPSSTAEKTFMISPARVLKWSVSPVRLRSKASRFWPLRG